jgi:hypothetical protein
LGRKPNELPDNGMGSVYTTVVYGAWKLLLACMYAQSLPSGVYEAEVKFGMEKLAVVCVPSSLGGQISNILLTTSKSTCLRRR